MGSRCIECGGRNVKGISISDGIYCRPSCKSRRRGNFNVLRLQRRREEEEEDELIVALRRICICVGVVKSRVLVCDTDSFEYLICHPVANKRIARPSEYLKCSRCK